MADVFISYKREEIAWAARVAQALAEEGFSAFYDLDEGGIHAGEEWDKRREAELAAAGCCIVLWSPASAASPNVRSEARRANARGLLAPAKIAPCEAPIGLDALQEADLIAWAGDRTAPQWRFLIDRGVARKLGRPGRPPAPPAFPAEVQPDRGDEDIAAWSPRLPRWALPVGATAVVAIVALGALSLEGGGATTVVRPPVPVVQSNREVQGIITNPTWLRRPGAREYDAHYPPRARERELEGRVVLDCVVSANGRLGCTVASEDPPGWGFGDAAVLISLAFQMAPATIDGSPTNGRSVRVRMNFYLPNE